MSEVTHGCEPHRKAARFRPSPNFRVIELHDFVNHIVTTVFVHVQQVCKDGKWTLCIGGQILIVYSSAKSEEITPVFLLILACTARTQIVANLQEKEYL